MLRTPQQRSQVNLGRAGEVMALLIFDFRFSTDPTDY
jgi:hypothetical protein